jgi:hypothetical protein
MMLFYSAQIHLRKVLNRVHTDLYKVEKQGQTNSIIIVSGAVRSFGRTIVHFPFGMAIRPSEREMPLGATQDLYNFAYWTCLQLESDLLAELDIPASGISPEKSNCGSGKDGPAGRHRDQQASRTEHVLAHCHCGLLAGLYAGQLAHPFQSHSWISQASRACQVLVWLWKGWASWPA